MNSLYYAQILKYCVNLTNDCSHVLCTYFELLCKPFTYYFRHVSERPVYIINERELYFQSYTVMSYQRFIIVLHLYKKWPEAISLLLSFIETLFAICKPNQTIPLNAFGDANIENRY